MAVLQTYSGPQCPRCSRTLADSDIRSGSIDCSGCGGSFEATAFDPPRPPLHAAAAVHGAGPVGAAACANHPRNAAATSCQRCGLFICSLCEMDIGTGAFCPSCFDRVRADGSIFPAVARHTDYASLARLTLIVGLVVPLVGGAALYYAIRALKQRRREERPVTGIWIAIVIAVAEVIGNVVLIGLFIVGLVQ